MKISLSLICHIVWFALFSAFIFAQEGTTEGPESKLANFLTANQIEPSEQGVRRYLASLLPHDIDAIVSPLVSKLGSDSYRERERALRNLKHLPDLTVETVEKHIGQNKRFPERVARLKKVIEHLSSKQTPDVQLAVFQHLAKEQYAGLFSDIVAVYPKLHVKRNVRKAACDAITTTAEIADYPALLKLLNEPVLDDQYLRVAALRAMWRIDSKSTAATILSKISDLEGQLAMESAIKLIEIEEVQSLEILLPLLNNDSYRSRALYTLRRLTGKKLSFAEFNKEQERQKNINNLRDWIAANPAEISFSRKPENARLGLTLVTDYHGGKIVEYDESGEEVWAMEAEHPFACKGLPNGHRLIGLYTERKLIEYDADGKIYKEFTDLPAYLSGIDRTEDGRTLIAAGQSGDKVMELDSEGNVLLDLIIPGSPTSIEQLENGNFLLSLYGTSKVVEIDREGTIQHEISVKSRPYQVSQLENGNYLVACSAAGELLEYTRKGELVWELKAEPNLYHAQRLEDGSTVYADKTGLFHIDPDSDPVSDPINGFGDSVYSYRY